METDILKITPQDVVLQLNGLQDIGLPLIGQSYGAAPATVLGYAKRSESVVLSTIPEMYRQLTREVRGEIVVEMAYAGQTQFTLGLSPVVENSVHLYVDFGRPVRSGVSGSSINAVNVIKSSTGAYGGRGRIPYTFRDIHDRLPSKFYTVDNDTGIVTLNGADHPTDPYVLSASSKVYADYDHTGMHRCHSLRDVAIRLAAANFGMTLGGITDSARDFLMQMEANAMNQLYAMMRGEAGVDLLDQLKLVDETRQPYAHPKRGVSLFM